MMVGGARVRGATNLVFGELQYIYCWIDDDATRTTWAITCECMYTYIFLIWSERRSNHRPIWIINAIFCAVSHTTRKHTHTASIHQWTYHSIGCCGTMCGGTLCFYKTRVCVNALYIGRCVCDVCIGAQRKTPTQNFRILYWFYEYEIFCAVIFLYLQTTICCTQTI